jgi:phosphatidylglycerophosphatase C
VTGEHVSRPTADGVVVAAFDFDETITRHDTVVPFMMRITGRARFALGLARRAPAIVAAIVRRDRNALRAVGTAVAFSGRRLADVEHHAAAWGAEIVHSHLRPDVVGRIRWHLDAGHRVVIVSASYEQYVHVVAGHLGVHGVVATRLDVAGEVCTGRLHGLNCRAAEKVVRLDAWLAEQGLSRSAVTLWAYGDSAGDRELLAAAQHPHWVAGSLDSVPASS